MPRVKNIRAGGKRSLAVKRKRTFKSPLDKAKGHEVVWSQVSALLTEGHNSSSFVYLIGEEDGPVKIGVAKDPIARLRGMQTGNPRPLRVEYVLVGDMRVEKLLHELWEPYAILSAANRNKVGAPPGTEWFHPEVRGELCPIIETAVELQLEQMRHGHYSDLDVMERLVRDAHKAHGFVAQQREQRRILGAHGGYVTPRPSRI